MSVALVTALRSAVQASEPGGSSAGAAAGLADRETLGSELGFAARPAERLHAVPMTSTVNPSKAAQNGRGMLPA
jgi:hypothetical protein